MESRHSVGLHIFALSYFYIYDNIKYLLKYLVVSNYFRTFAL